MKETCQNLVRSVVQREDLQIQKENTGKENRMLNWVRAGYGWETSVIVGMSSDQFYEWKPTLKWRKLFWTGNSGKCNVYILTMKINRTLWLIEVKILFRRWIHRRKYTKTCIFIRCIFIVGTTRAFGRLRKFADNKPVAIFWCSILEIVNKYHSLIHSFSHISTRKWVKTLFY